MLRSRLAITLAFTVPAALAALLTAASCTRGTGGSHETSTREAPPAMKFLALGDSYTIGESVGELDRWPAQLVRELRERGVPIEDAQIIARTGWTTDQLAEEIRSAWPQGPFALVTLQIGVNNQFRGRPLDEYRKEFAALLDQAVGFAGGNVSHVIVLSIPDWGVTPYAAGRDRAQIAAEIDRFNLANAAETRRAGAHYVDITPASRSAAQDSTLIAKDGLHPSARMYALWVTSAMPAALEALKAADR